jgi:hypothetical protein
MGLEDLLKGMTNISKIKLHGGLVGKVCIVLIVMCILFTGLAAWMKDIVFAFVLMGLMFGTAVIFLWKLISFAGKNPYAALLEGAEFLVHEQIIYGAKNNPKIVNDKIIEQSNLGVLEDYSKENEL